MKARSAPRVLVGWCTAWACALWEEWRARFETSMRMYSLVDCRGIALVEIQWSPIRTRRDFAFAQPEHCVALARNRHRRDCSPGAPLEHLKQLKLSGSHVVIRAL